MDESSDSPEAFLNKYKKLRNAQRWYQLSQMRFTLNDIVSYYKQGDKKYFYKGLLSVFFPRFLRKFFRNYLLYVEELFNSKKGEAMVCPYGEYYLKEYQRKEWYEGYAELPFGELKVRVPVDYHAFLTHVYGDYMKLPPKERQVSHHYHYFLNMDRGMTIDEVREELKKKRRG